VADICSIAAVLLSLFSAMWPMPLEISCMEAFVSSMVADNCWLAEVTAPEESNTSRINFCSEPAVELSAWISSPISSLLL